MPIPPLSPIARQLLERLTVTPDHDRFVGAPVAIAGLTPHDYGSLWPAVQAARARDAHPAARAVAEAIIEQAGELRLTPLFDAGSALAALRAVSLPEIAVECLGRLNGEAPPGLAVELRRILGEPAKWTHNIHQSYVLARWSGAATRAELAALVTEKHRDAPYLLAEFAILDQLSDQAVLALGGSRWIGIYWAGPAGDADGSGDPALVLAEEPAYVSFARDALQRAVQRLGEIHAGTVPYVADGAFALDDTAVIARAARVAAQRDEPWFPEIIGSLLPQSCVAPTAAKTAPSQSLAIALGHSVEGVPTPEAVQALREALGVVRHAGVQKKLSRNLKPAERALMERPEVALRMLANLKSGKREQAMLASSLESGYWLETSLEMDAWRALVRSAAGAPVAQALVWTLAGEGAGFLVKATPQGMRATDSAGRPVTLPDASRVRLWHPLGANEAERAAWQAVLSERRLRQPFRQVYREFYLPPTDFSGHVLAVRRLLGLARREGWRIGDDDLLRGFGGLRVGLPVDGRLYPGAEGYCVSTGLRFERRDGNGWRDFAPDGIAPVVFSEACRAVDLLVSTAGIALDDDGAAVPDELRMLHLQRLSEVRPGRMADLRRRALLQIFAPLIAAGSVAVGERDVRVGDFAVSLATGRVTRGGAPVASPERPEGARLGALPWLPYDEVLLERIVDTVGVLVNHTN